MYIGLICEVALRTLHGSRGARNNLMYMHWLKLINTRTQVVYHTVCPCRERLLFDTPGHMTTRR